MHFTDHDYAEIAMGIKISSIKSAVSRIDFIYLCKIVNHFVDCSTILSKILLRVPTRVLRNLGPTFETPFPRCPFASKSITIGLCMKYNNKFEFFDIFADTFYSVHQLTCKVLDYS